MHMSKYRTDAQQASDIRDILQDMTEKIDDAKDEKNTHVKELLSQAQAPVPPLSVRNHQQHLHHHIEC